MPKLELIRILLVRTFRVLAEIDCEHPSQSDLRWLERRIEELYAIMKEITNER